MLNFISKIFGTKSEKDIKQIKPLVTEINEFYEQLDSLSDDELKAKTTEFQTFIAENKQSIEDEKTDIINNYETDEIIQMETNIDNTIGEDLGFTAKLLLKSGALDVSFTPIFMKKFRPAYKLEVLCKESDLRILAEIIFSNTSTIGLRYSIKKRYMLRRENFIKQTNYGDVRGKKITKKRLTEESLEFDDIEKIALENKISILDARKV